MHTDNLDIKQYLAYSKRLSGLSTTHLQEKQQLLNHIKQLHNCMDCIIAENEFLKAGRAEDRKIINEQAQRIADLQQNTTVNVAGSYIQNQNIGIQYKLPPAHPKHRTGKNKSSINNPKQLSLWKNP